jgi:HD-like signal output (HDOD) protein
VLGKQLGGRQSGESMNMKADPAFEFVKQLGNELASNDFDLPPFPDIALRVREALNDPGVSIDTLSRIAVSEPVLTARLMRMANSAMLHRGTLEITNLKTAISRIGLDMVHNAAVSLALNQAFPAREDSILYNPLGQNQKTQHKGLCIFLHYCEDTRIQ